MEQTSGNSRNAVVTRAAVEHGPRQGRNELPGFVVTLTVAMGVGPLLLYGLTAVGPLVIDELRLTRTQFGALATLTFTAAAVSSGFFGRLADRYSERTTMLVLYAGSAGALAAAALARSYAALVVAVVASGCVQSMSNPVTNRLISAHAPARGRGTLMGVKQAGVQMAQFTTGLVFPSLALVIGWRGGLAVAAAVAALGLVFAWRHLPPRPRRGPAPAAPLRAGALPAAVWWLTGYALLTGAALQASNVYLPLYGFEELGLPVANAGLVAAVVGGVGLVARIAWGRGTDFLASARSPLLVLSLAAGLGVVCVHLADAHQVTGLFWAGAAMFGGTALAANVVLMIAVLRASPSHVVGRASGVLAIGLYSGFALGPVSFGALVDRTGRYEAGWLAVALAYVASAVLVLAARNRLRPPTTATASPQGGSMLTKEQNTLLTRTDPGTLMGRLFRRYWIPALLAEEIPTPDCPPVRVKLLGENLIAFRDSRGRIGLLDEFCSHRTASLFFGRNEECGLRCAYHGWKYDVDGNCVDMPSEPEGSRFPQKIRHTAYPCVERAGLIWTYMGPKEYQPELPELEWALLGEGQRFISKRWQESNYLQAMEGGIDSSHVSFAHRFNIEDDPMHRGTEGNKYLKADTRPKFEVAESDGGLVIGARRKADAEHYYWRITQWIMPWYTIIPPFGTHNPLGAHAWVPIDDENCWAWSINYHPTRDLTEEELRSMRDGQGIHVQYVPGTYRTRANKANDYLIDREAQAARKTYSGVEGISMQDASLQESMGTICDRTKERLGTSDAGIILARRRLLAALEQLEEDGDPQALPGIDTEHQRVRSTSLLLPTSTPFQEGAADALKAVPGQDFVSI